MSMPNPMRDDFEPPARSGWVHDHPITTGLGIALVLAIVVVIILLLTGGLAANPPYSTWCDQGPNGNRIYESHSGDIAVVPADKTC
jgi:hypothetical protein